jgi:CheY-like chemotaxis protein
LEQLTRDLETRVHERTGELRASQQQLQALASELTLTEQRERKRLATDLHDYLAQLLVLMRMKMRQAAPLVREAKATSLLMEVDQTITQSLDYTRSLVAELTPPTLKEFGLIEALGWLVEQMRRHDLVVSVKRDMDTISLPDDQAVLLFQSVRELLLNVVKHSGTKQATVTVDAPQPTELRITVEDAGRGFDPEDMERKSRSGGFGLFSIRQRMEAMGGRLHIDSSPESGARLSLVVPHWPQTEEPSSLHPSEKLNRESSEQPVVELQPEIASPTRVSSPVQKGQTVRVLLVDDHAMVRQGLRSILEGYPDLQVVGEASDGIAAVELTNTLEPDVVVMDVSLPQLDGPEATRRIKRHRPDTTVIGLSINRTSQVKDAMTEAGALTYLTKESAVEQLHEAIVTAMGEKQEA